MGMIVHRSNRSEQLLEALVELVRTPLADPTVPETIVVHGRGMARWLSLELARRLGIWANPGFPFPRRVIDAAAAAVLGDAPENAARFAPEALLWAVLDELPRHLESAAFTPLRTYLADDVRGRQRGQLAARIADLFDQYAVFRPEMVLGWEAGREPRHWQAILWRALVARLGAVHPAARGRELLAGLRAGRLPRAPFPPRLSFFGLSTLPPLYVEILAALAGCLELHLFVLSPTEHYWGDLVTPRRARRLLRGRSPTAAADQHLVGGPPLLASLGRIGREFAAVVEAAADYEARDHYTPPSGDSVLATLQADLLALHDRGGAGADDPPRLALPADDDSITVHVCHSPMREIEVLHDQLAGLFAADPTLQPHDIVVMTPAIDPYAPLIEAVFSSPNRPAIPFRTADRRARADGEVLDVLMRALEVLEGRLTASAVLDLLTLEPVRTRFGISGAALEQLRPWMRAAEVRWGADADHRAEEELPHSDQNTWHFGLQRLLVGYALPEDGDALFADVRPLDDVEGAQAAVLGSLASYLEALRTWRTALKSPRHPEAWRTELGTLLATLVARTRSNADQHEAILSALDTLARRAGAAGFTGVVDLRTMRDLLEREVEREVAPRGFVTGAVTLCELQPMRSIPFRVVCLIGLNDDAFPRPRRPLGFDRMAAAPRLGDRNPRDDDRYLFLEALLSARQRLLLTYVGRGVSDNASIPPSVVVSELTDAIDRAFTVAGDRRASEALTVIHPLQPFSPRYFGADPDRRLVSFARGHCAGARALRAPRAAAPPFVSVALADDPPSVVDLDALIHFLENPARAFLRDRLDLVLPRDAELLDDRDPAELDDLERWRIGDLMLARALAGADRQALWQRLRAEGRLPLGTPGRALFERLATDVDAIAAAVTQRRRAPLGRREIDLTFGAVRLVGAVPDVDADGAMVTAQFSRVAGRHELRLWLRHLARCAVDDAPAPSTLVGRGARNDIATVQFAPAAAARQHLGELLELYRAGRCRPLPLFTHASREYAQRLQCGATAEAALAAACTAARTTEHHFGDDDDPYVRQLYGALPDALPGASDAFARAARAVYDPLLSHRCQT